MNGIQTIIAEIDRQINQLPRDHGSELALKALTELRSIADAQRGADSTVLAEIVKEFRDKVKSWQDHAVRGAKVNFSGVHQGKIDLCDSLLEDIKEIAAKYAVKIEEGDR